MNKQQYYTRAIKLKFFCTKSKQNKITQLIHLYKKAVNFYLQTFEQEEGKLDKQTLARLTNTKLSERYKSNALKQALEIHKSCKKKKKKLIKFNGNPILDSKFINIEQGQNTFDLWIKLSTLAKGKRIYLPTKKHKRLNYWLNKGNLVQGCELHSNKIIVWVKILKDNYKSNGKEIGIDIGMNKLITTSENEYYGTQFNQINNKILRKQKNSKAYKRALKQRDNYINQTINSLDWNNIKLICYENIKYLKHKRKNKSLNIKLQHWTYKNLLSRLMQKAQEYRVRLVYVNPKNTSRTCPICNNVDEANRILQNFSCLMCGYKHDADFVGATNVLNKGLYWLRSLESLNNKSNI